MLPLKFYRLHFQVRKNISTSKRFQKHLLLGSGPRLWGRRGLDLFSCGVTLGSLAARAQHPGNEQAPRPALQSPHSHSLPTSFTAPRLPLNSLFNTRAP